MNNTFTLQRIILTFICFVCLAGNSFAANEKIDSAAVAKIKDEAMNKSHVMEMLSYICDVYGPRLTGSPEYYAAAGWAKKKLEEIGLVNAHLESWGPFGRGWSLKNFTASVTAPVFFPLIAYPKAWSPGLKSTAKSKVIYVDAKTETDLDKHKGTLKNAIVMINDVREVKAHFTPDAIRMHDTTLLKLANAIPLSGARGGRRFEVSEEQRTQFMLAQKKFEMCVNEGAACVVTPAAGDDGTIFVQQVSTHSSGEGFIGQRGRPYDRVAQKNVPQIGMAVEHYNRIMRMLSKGIDVKMDLSFTAEFFDKDSMGYNIIAEIPGTDLKDEIVMLGAHFDSWHSGTGATDNGAGSAVCMEVVRILQATGLKPRRTIRIALWGGEEQGLLGSRAYVSQHVATRDTSVKTGPPRFDRKPEFDKLSAYFNLDNGTGKIRGVYMQGNEAVRPIFQTWLGPFRDVGAATLTISNTGGTDHGSFDQVGIPGFQFIQDPMDYDSRTHHSNMDVYDRIQADDMKQAAAIMATFVYHAAMRDQKIPRKEEPAPRIQ